MFKFIKLTSQKWDEVMENAICRSPVAAVDLGTRIACVESFKAGL